MKQFKSLNRLVVRSSSGRYECLHISKEEINKLLMPQGPILLISHCVSYFCLHSKSQPLAEALCTSRN